LTIILTIEQQEIKRFEYGDWIEQFPKGKRKDATEFLVRELKIKHPELFRMPGVTIWISFESKMNNDYDKLNREREKSY
jgi:hypothetical protein